MARLGVVARSFPLAPKKTFDRARSFPYTSCFVRDVSILTGAVLEVGNR